MHLQIAEQILVNCGLNGAVRTLIDVEYPAYYFGHVAPDYQWLCGIPRVKTHFYGLPPKPDDKAFTTMMVNFPELADGSMLPAAQAVFVAAYSAHLMLDLLWFREVLMPLFVLPAHWKSHRHRFIAHNTLLTYLDRLAVASLPKHAGMKLAAAEPNSWLPFAKDADLIRWRDMLVQQLEPDSPIQTVSIYAERLAMTPDELEARLRDPIWMEENLYQKVPLENVVDVLDSAVAASVDLINDYLVGT